MASYCTRQKNLIIPECTPDRKHAKRSCRTASYVPARVCSKELAAHAWKNLLADHGKSRLQGVVHLDLTIFANSGLVLCKSSRNDLLNQSLICLTTTDEKCWLKQLTKSLGEKLLKDASVLGLISCDCDQAGLSIVHHTGNMVVTMLQNLQPGRVEHVAALDLLLQVHLLLLPLIVLHDLQPLLLDQSSFLNVELF